MTCGARAGMANVREALRRFCRIRPSALVIRHFFATLTTMRMIGTVPGETEAERFTAYLLTLKIDAYAEKSETSGEWLVWVEHDDLIDRGRDELALFKANPADPKYAVESQASRIRREKEAAALRRKKNYTDVRTSWSGVQRFAAPVTLALVAISVVTFLIVQGSETRAARVIGWVLFEPGVTGATEKRAVAKTKDSMKYVQMLQNLPSKAGNRRDAFAAATDAIRSGEVWRIWTPMFMHGGIGHIFFNMLLLLSWGGRIESRKGPWVLVAIVLVGGCIAHVGEAMWETLRLIEHQPVAPAAAALKISVEGLRFFGMSGVNYAIFGFLWIYGRLRPHDGLTLQQQDVGLALGWLVICFTGWVGPIANAAHVMGLVAGVAMAWAYVRRTRRA